MFEKTSKEMKELGRQANYLEFLFDWVQGLLDNERPEKALPLLHAGLRESEEFHALRHTVRFSLQKADAYFQLGDIQEARAMLARFDKLYKRLGHGEQVDLRADKIKKEILSVRIYLNDGDQETAVVILRECLADIETFTADLDGGAFGYLWLGRYDYVRQLLMDLVSCDPELEYGATLYWRSLPRLIGGKKNRNISAVSILGSPSIVDSLSIDGYLRSLARAAVANVEKRQAAHLTYAVKDGELWRWTVSGGEVRRDKIALPLRELEELVSRTWDELSTDPGGPDAPLPPKLVHDLHTLAHHFLPDGIFTIQEGASKPMILFSADNFLSRIPMEALNIGSVTGYVPLLFKYDVAYLRYSDHAATGSASGKCVVLAAPEHSPQQLKRHPYLGKLKEAAAEGEAVSTLLPDATFLHGFDATKRNLTERWEDARVIYLAAHVLRDPEVPYLNLIPLAEPSVLLSPDDSYLDMSDIHTADLHRCDLVVLSGCASGAPYLPARGTAPCLGDAFLDAGAGAVVQTFWSVKDTQARELMIGFVRELNQGRSKVHALGEVRRAALVGPRGVRHPFNWAAFSIQLGRI